MQQLHGRQQSTGICASIWDLTPARQPWGRPPGAAARYPIRCGRPSVLRCATAPCGRHANDSSGTPEKVVCGKCRLAGWQASGCRCGSQAAGRHTAPGWQRPCRGWLGRRSPTRSRGRPPAHTCRGSQGRHRHMQVGACEHDHQCMLLRQHSRAGRCSSCQQAAALTRAAAVRG